MVTDKGFKLNSEGQFEIITGRTTVKEVIAWMQTMPANCKLEPFDADMGNYETNFRNGEQADIGRFALRQDSDCLVMLFRTLTASELKVNSAIGYDFEILTDRKTAGDLIEYLQTLPPDLPVHPVDGMMSNSNRGNNGEPIEFGRVACWQNPKGVTMFFDDLTASEMAEDDRFEAAEMKDIEMAKDRSPEAVGKIVDDLLEIYRGSYVKNLRERFIHLFQLQEGWDGYHAGVLRYSSVEFAMKVLQDLEDAGIPAPDGIAPANGHDIGSKPVIRTSNLVMDWFSPDIEISLSVRDGDWLDCGMVDLRIPEGVDDDKRYSDAQFHTRDGYMPTLRQWFGKYTAGTSNLSGC